eukprot:4376879-Pyramimonas_sp.AAC.1
MRGSAAASPVRGGGGDGKGSGRSPHRCLSCTGRAEEFGHLVKTPKGPQHRLQQTASQGVRYMKGAPCGVPSGVWYPGHIYIGPASVPTVGGQPRRTSPSPVNGVLTAYCAVVAYLVTAQHTRRALRVELAAPEEAQDHTVWNVVRGGTQRAHLRVLASTHTVGASPNSSQWISLSSMTNSYMILDIGYTACRVLYNITVITITQHDHTT